MFHSSIRVDVKGSDLLAVLAHSASLNTAISGSYSLHGKERRKLSVLWKY